MPSTVPPPDSRRRDELLELAYRYVLDHGVAELSLRPLAAAINSSPRVLLYLFGSKAGLVQAVLARAREDELNLLRRARDVGNVGGLCEVAAQLWSWLAAEEHRALLTLWFEGYARSLIDSDSPWTDFARRTVDDWLQVLAEAELPDAAPTPAAEAERTLVLAVLRGAMLDLLATGDITRTTNAVERQLSLLRHSR